MKLRPYLIIPKIWDNCATQQQQIRFLKRTVDDLEDRILELETWRNEQSARLDNID